MSNQFFQNGVLDDHPQGGEGQAVRGEGEVAGLLAVGEERPLMGREGGAAPAAVLGQVQPGGQPQLQNEVVLGAAVPVGRRTGRPGDEGGGVGGVIKAFARKAAVGGSAQTQIVPAVPVDAVVPPLDRKSVV